MSKLSVNKRSADTRQRLLRAGVRVFAELGFDPATTRQLASQAGVNLAAIPYHFENKRGLYLAVAGHVADQIADRMLPAIDTMATVAADRQATPAELRAALHEILANMTHLIIGEPDAEAWAAFILREQAQPTEAFDLIYGRVMKPVFETVIALVARLVGASPDDPVIRLRAVALLGQLMIFRTSRAGVLRTLGWSDYDGDRLAQVLTAVTRQTDLLLDAMAGDHD